MSSRTKPCWNILSTPCFTTASIIGFRILVSGQLACNLEGGEGLKVNPALFSKEKMCTLIYLKIVPVWMVKYVKFPSKRQLQEYFGNIHFKVFPTEPWACWSLNCCCMNPSQPLKNLNFDLWKSIFCTRLWE